MFRSYGASSLGKAGCYKHFASTRRGSVSKRGVMRPFPKSVGRFQKSQIEVWATQRRR